MTIEQVFDDDKTYKVFQQVVDQRKVQFKEVSDALGQDRELTRSALGRLKDAHLIAERGAPIEDFSVFYVTAEGLEAQRKLRRLESIRSGLSALL